MVRGQVRSCGGTWSSLFRARTSGGLVSGQIRHSRALPISGGGFRRAGGASPSAARWGRLLLVLEHEAWCCLALTGTGGLACTGRSRSLAWTTGSGRSGGGGGGCWFALLLWLLLRLLRSLHLLCPRTFVLTCEVDGERSIVKQLCSNSLETLQNEL